MEKKGVDWVGWLVGCYLQFSELCQITEIVLFYAIEEISRHGQRLQGFEALEERFRQLLKLVVLEAPGYLNGGWKKNDMVIWTK